MDLRELGERETISRLRKAIGVTSDMGRGEDDCAVIPLDDGTLLLASTDMVLEGTHVLPGATPDMIGSFAVEVAVSDVAAMGGRPLGVLCGYAMPPGTEVGWLQGVTHGMARTADSHGISLVGGDTKRSPEPTVAVTALGVVAAEECMFRRGAREGDALVLTGPVGGPALGYVSERHPDGSLREEALALVYRVRARVMAGRALASSGSAHACIDLSDGLAPCLDQMMTASGTGAEVRWEDVPVVDGLEEATYDTGWHARDMALNWGGEYELLAAVDPEGAPHLVKVLETMGLEPAVVGTVHGRRGQNILHHDSGREALRPHGFDHFKA